DERDAILELAQIGRDVRADADARALADEADVADGVEEAEADVAADVEEGRALDVVIRLDAEEGVAEHLEERGALLLVAVRPARDRRVDLEEVPGVPAQRERATDVAVALRSGRRRVVEREPAVDEEE